MYRKTVWSALAALVLTGAVLMPSSAKAEEIGYTSPPAKEYYLDGKFDRQKYIDDLNIQAEKIHDAKSQLSTLSTGMILEDTINYFFEPDTTWDVGWDHQRQENGTAKIVNEN